MLKSLCNSFYRINSKKDLWIQQLELYSMVANVNTENKSIDTDKFSKKENAILKIVNTSNLKELKRYIKLPYAEAIISCRNSHGSYKSLKDFMSRNKIESDVLDELYHSINNYKPRSKKLSYRSTIIPQLIIEQIPKTTLGIHVGKNFVTWASVTNNFEVLEWDSIRWVYKELPKNSYDVIKLIGPIFQKLPTYDSYVAEEMGFQKVTSVNLLYYQVQLTVAIMACLKLMENQRTNDSLAPVNSIYMLKPRVSAKYHKLIVGSEIISPSYFMNKIINNNSKSSNDELSVVYVNDVHKNNYLEANVYEQEEMSWCLLKALTFMRLVKSFTDEEMK